MNIVTPIPTAVVFTPSNVNTEAARRDNVMRETIPQTSGTENSAAETGLGSDADRVKTPGQTPAPVTYERPQPNQSQTAGQADNTNQQDNGKDPSAGREDAESRQEEQQQQAEKREIEELKARDREVRTHEQAHASVGGQYAGSPTYEYESGPDGQRYAVGGEVSIDISAENTPEETLRKMQQVRAAALAPAEPSPQDLRVASEANQKAQEARADIVEERAEETEQSIARAFPERAEESAKESQPDLDDIVKGAGAEPPTRELSEDPVAEAAGLEIQRESERRLASRDEGILRRVGVIESFYQNVTLPKETGLQQSA